MTLANVDAIQAERDKMANLFIQLAADQRRFENDKIQIMTEMFAAGEGDQIDSEDMVQATTRVETILIDMDEQLERVLDAWIKLGNILKENGDPECA